MGMHRLYLRCRSLPALLPSRRGRALSTPTFVSQHFTPDVQDMKKVVEAMDSDTRVQSDGTLQVKICRLCTKGNKDNVGNLWKLFVRKDGSYFCHRCSQGGNWMELKKKTVGTGGHINLLYAKDSFEKHDVQTRSALPVVIPATLDLFTHSSDSPNGKNATKVLEFLNGVRGINSIFLMRYGVGMAVIKFLGDNGQYEDQLCVTFPWMLSKEVKQKEGKDGDSAKVTAEGEKGEMAMEIVRIKYRALKTKGLQRILPKGGEWGFFGWHTVRPHHTEIIITEGEYDAMAVAQGLSLAIAEAKLSGDTNLSGTKASNLSKVKAAKVAATVKEDKEDKDYKEDVEARVNLDLGIKTEKKRKVVKKSVVIEEGMNWDIPAISLPNGCNSLPLELVPLLERFDKIYLWMDNDKSGQDSVVKFAQKLGLRRCHIVKPGPTMQDPPKDANDALRQNPRLITEMLSQAAVLSHDRIQRFSDYRSLVLSAILRKDQTDGGSQTPSIPKLSRICKGFRGGELVVFTGPTGAGKTTLLSQLSLDFAKQGVPTLWASFEILNSKLMEKMLRQSYRKGDLSLLSSKALDEVADDFSALPLLFLNFYGASDIDLILEAMDYAVYKDDVKHIILDNLQFMLPRSATSGSFDKFTMQDVVIERFRRFATEKSVNVILVVHPRKEDEDVNLNLASVFGSAKATQEADIVLILQGRRGAYTSIDIKKNRFDGSLGKVYLQYSQPLHSFVEANEEDAISDMSTQLLAYKKKKS